MPKKIDPTARREQIADALWRVTRSDGWEAATMRRVAAEAGVSVGLLQHYFTTKDQMLQFALNKIGENYGARITGRITALPTPRNPRDVVEIILTELLPTESEGHAEVQAAAAFLGRAVLHPDIAAPMVAAGAHLRTYVAALIPDTADQPPDEAAATLLALSDGLIAHLFTGRLTLDTAHRIIVAQLDRLFGPRTG